tara:strand:+ start:1824 stop:2324 length:501 start_codon:yes stop_codon:yes gene_type:complete
MKTMVKSNAKDNNVTTHILRGVAHWAQLVEPNTTFEPVWSLDLVLTPETLAIVQAEGLNVKNKGDDRGDFVSLKRKVLKKDGSKKDAPSVTDSKLNTWNGNTLIGNGSEVNVKIQCFDYTYAGKSGRSADLVAVQVVNLVEYKRPESGFEAVEGGYVGEKEEAPAF